MMKKRMIRSVNASSRWVSLTLSGALVGMAMAQITWDGDASDGSWVTASNWSGDVAPVAADTVVISNGDTVDIVGLGSGVLPSGATVSVSGGSTLTQSSGAARLNGSTINLTADGKIGSGFWDLNNGTVNFSDGATTGSSDWEHKGTNAFSFTLSATGFQAVTPGRLRSGAGAAWSDVTYTIDISTYDIANGLSVVLADFTGHDAGYGGAFDPTIHVVAGASGLGGFLSFDTATSQLVLQVDAPGNDLPIADNQSVRLRGVDPINIILSASDPETPSLTYSVVTSPANGVLSGTAPNLIYTPTGAPSVNDSFTFTANDGEDDSAAATVSLVWVPETATALWSSLQNAIENDALNAQTHLSWTEDGIEMSQICYDLGTLTGTQRTASPKIGAYYAYPSGGTNLPGLVQIHGGGQRANKALAKYWAQQGYAAVSINWGGLELEPGVANTDWDGLAVGFTRPGVTEAIHHNFTDPDSYVDGGTLYDIPHPLNSSWLMNSYAARRALTFLTEQTIVDDSKLGVLGWSMGGRTTTITATDPRLTVVGPGVGGTGFLYEDWWGLPGSARSSNGVQDMELYLEMVDSKSYWPNISVPTLYLEASNDFNAPFDLVTRALALLDPAVEQRLAFAPHFNHRLDANAAAARVLWMKSHLTGTFDYPETSVATLDLVATDGVPVFKVWPDTSTSHAVKRVDIYYGVDRNSLRRFWRDAEAVDQGTHWEAPCPVFDTEEMMVALAVVTYDVGFSLPLTPGFSPTTEFSLASEVKTVYPTDLATAGVKATAERIRLIDDFSRGYHDWFQLNPENPHHWQRWTRKLNDPSWTGPEGGNLALDVTTDGTNNTLGIRLLSEWNESPAVSYSAQIPLTTAGVASLSLPMSSFLNEVTGQPLASWDDVVAIGIMPGNRINTALAQWDGTQPTLANLRWVGGDYTFLNGVTGTWLAANELPLNNLATLDDDDGDRFVNWEEWLAGTNPHDAGSALRLTTSWGAGGQLLLEWPAVVGKNYDIWFSESLAEGLWTLYQGDVPFTAPSGSATVPMPGDLGFYRVGVR